MAILTLEGGDENGRFRLPDEVVLPDHAEAYIVIPVLESRTPARIDSPRLAHPEHAAAFARRVIEVPPDVEP